MSSQALKAARHRKAMAFGITISVGAHVAALAIVTVPGAGPGDAEPTANKFVPESFEAMEIVELQQPTEATQTTASPVESTSSAAPASAVELNTPRSLEARMADLAPAQLSAAIPETSRPVITFSDLKPVSQADEMLAAFASAYGIDSKDEEDGGGFSGLLGRLGVALSGGGHCPTPGGPLILR